MKTFVKFGLGSGVLALAAASVMADDSFEQRYKAKYGRPSPSEEARQNAEQNNSASRQETTGSQGQDQDNWIDQHHRAKYGRSTPSQERDRGR